MLGEHLFLHKVENPLPMLLHQSDLKYFFFISFGQWIRKKISMNNKQIKDGCSSVCVWMIKIVICIVGDQQRSNSVGMRMGKADGNGEWKERFQTSFLFLFILFGNMSVNVGASRIINILRSVFFLWNHSTYSLLYFICWYESIVNVILGVVRRAYLCVYVCVGLFVCVRGVSSWCASM